MIMRKFVSLHKLCAMVVASGIILLAATSCGGGGGKDNPTPTPTPTPTTETLSVSPTSLTLAGGASGTVNITSNVAWTVSASTGYTVSPSNGSNNGTVTITASSSATGGTVTIKGKTKTVSVTVSAPAASSITVTPESVSIPAVAGNGQFGITCSGAWTITLPSPKPAWMTSVSPMSGTGNTTVTIVTSNYTEKTKSQTFLTIKSGTNTKYLTVTKEGATNNPPTKPTGLKPTGSGVETITTFSWNASTDPNGDKIKYNVMLSKDNSNWTTIATTEKTSVMNSTELDKNTTYYYKVMADDGYEGGKAESDVVTFTTTSTKSYWADGESKLYEVGPDGTPTEVTSTTRPFILVYTGDGYTQDLFNYGGQFDTEIQKGIKALFQIEPYKHYYYYFAIYVIAAYSNEAGMSVYGRNDNANSETWWANATTKVDTKFKCTWYGGNSTSIVSDKETVFQYAMKVPGITTMTDITKSPISIIINADQYAGTNTWLYSSAYGGMNVVSIAMTPARHPASSSYGGFEYTLRHEFGGHGIGLLGDEYVYYSSQKYPKDNESNFRIWQTAGCYSNVYLPEWDNTASSWGSPEWDNTPNIDGKNWNTFYSRTDYSGAAMGFFSGALMYGLGIYRSESGSCMIDNITHYNTVSRWKIYCRIKRTAGETPDLDEFISNDVERVNPYSSGAPATKSAATPPARRCEGPILIDPYHKKPYRLR